MQTSSKLQLEANNQKGKNNEDNYQEHVKVPHVPMSILIFGVLETNAASQYLLILRI